MNGKRRGILVPGASEQAGFYMSQQPRQTLDYVSPPGWQERRRNGRIAMSALGLSLISVVWMVGCWWLMLGTTETVGGIPRDPVLIAGLFIGPFSAVLAIGLGRIAWRRQALPAAVTLAYVGSAMALLGGIIAPWGWFLFVPALLLGGWGMKCLRRRIRENDTLSRNF